MTNEAIDRMAEKKQRDQEITDWARRHKGEIDQEKLLDWVEQNPDSALYRYLEWNDSKAARLYRLDQLCTAIRSVKITTTISHHKVDVPVYVRDPKKEAPESGYRALQQVKRNEDWKRRTWIRELKQLDGLAERCRAISLYFDPEDQEALDTIREHVDIVLRRHLTDYTDQPRH